jgi:hypothetical protein
MFSAGFEVRFQSGEDGQGRRRYLPVSDQTAGILDDGVTGATESVVGQPIGRLVTGGQLVVTD